MPMVILRFVTGIALLTLGRKLFWLFVAGAGFLTATFLVRNYTQLQPEWLVILVALGAGIIGALVAVFLQRLAVGIAGFLVAGYCAVALLQLAGIDPGRLTWLPYIIGGVVGALLMAVLFEWALIALSSISGAALVAQTFSLGQALTALVFFGALLVGITIQSGMLMADRRRELYRERAVHDGP
jgi:hypothetical protein